jgi:hypothetical protein
MTPNQSHVAKWKAEQSPDAGWIVTDGNGNNWEEGGCTLAFLDEAKAEGFAYGLTSAQAKSAPAEPVSREAVQVVGVRISTDGFGSYIADSAMGIGGPAPGEVRESLMTVNQHNRMMAAPPSPDAELVELLSQCRGIAAKEVERWTRAAAILPVNADIESSLLTRIDAKLDSLK